MSRETNLQSGKNGQGDQMLLRCRAIHEEPIPGIHRLAPMLLQQFEEMKFQTATLLEDEFSIRLLQMKNGIKETLTVLRKASGCSA